MTNQDLEQEEESYDEERRRREREKKRKKRKEEYKAKVTSKIEKQKVHVAEKIEIPIVELDTTIIEIKEVEIDKEIPEIKEVEVKIHIPVIELEKSLIELKRVESDSTLPKIQEKESRLELPLIKLDEAREIRWAITTFDERLPKIQPPTERSLRVPIHKVSKSVVRETISSFDSRVDAQILQYFLIKEPERGKLKEEILTEEQKTEITPPESELSGGEEEFEEVPDIVDFVFGVSNSKISSRGPKIVLYKELEKDSTIGSFETLCIRIYREKEGGHPRIQPIKKFDEFNKREIEKWVKASKSLVTVDLDGDKKEAYNVFCEEKLREPLRRDIIGDVGFVIFKTRDTNLYRHCKKVLENLEKELEHPIDIVYVEPKALSLEMKMELSSFAWGNLKLDSTPPILIEEEKVERPYGTTFDDIFNKFSRSLFERQFERLENEDDGIYVFATEQHEGEESSEHLQIKWFIVKLLSKERNLKIREKIKDAIKTEEEYEGIIPDVRVDNSVYEIETLFAEDREGKIPKKKIENTITKYENTSIREINIVLDNLTFLRHLTELTEISNILKEWSKTYGKVINLYTLDFQNTKLIPLRDMIKRVKQLSAPSQF